METALTDVEVRVLGCLIEKAITTPDYYPLTLNALTNACNQKSNRNPVVSYEETTVVRGLDGLRDKGLANMVYKADSRAPKYQHFFVEKLELSPGDVAVLCELMIRGPQTPGELRAHTERMHDFGGLEEIEGALRGLMEREHPLVVRLPRQPGRKEQRYAHLLSGRPEIQEQEPAVAAESATLQVRSENERIARLEDEVKAIRAEIENLKKALIEFKAQF